MPCRTTSRRHAGALVLVCAGLAVAGGASALAEAPPRAAITGTRNPGQGAPAMPFASHRATYNITLASATGSKSPTAARGRVSYEFSGSACDGYSQVFRQVTELQPAEGATKLSDMRSATFEAGDGRSFSFDIKTANDQETPDVVDGRAERDASDILAVRLSKPKAQALQLDDDVLFPTSHIARIIGAAKAGKRVLEVKVFDGSDDGKKIYNTTTVIGHRLIGPADDPTAVHATALDTVQRWPVTISYFEDGRRDQGPAYVLGFELYENGVSRALRFDYGDFVLSGQMTSFDMLPAPSCKH